MGQKIFAGDGSAVSTPGAIADDVILIPQIPADQNNFAPNSGDQVSYINAGTWNFSSKAAINITGIQGGVSGRRCVLVNSGSFDITLVGESAASIAANRFSSSFVIAAGSACVVQWSRVSSRWMILSPAVSYNPVSGVYLFGSVTLPPTLKAPDNPNGDGTDMTISAGNGGGSNHDGGDLILNAGAVSGSAVAGRVILNTTSASFTITGDSQAGVLTAVFSSNSDSESDLITENLSAGANAAATITARNNAGNIIDVFITGSNWASTWVPNGPSGPQQGIVGQANLPLIIGAGSNAGLLLDSSGNVVATFGTRAVSGTNKFFYLPFLTGNQTGVPANLAGNYANAVPCLIQNNGGVFNFRAYVSGAWRSAAMV